MCTVVNGMSYKCQIDPVGIAKFCCILLDFLFILTVTVEEVLKSPMYLWISPFCSISFCLVYFDSGVVGYIFGVIMYYWRIHPFPFCKVTLYP